MKLAFVEIAGFRGFKDKTRFDFPGGFVVLTGRNGTGKSTVLDAVEFALTGTINKYAVKGAKGGGLDDHIWWVGQGSAEDQHVSLGLVDEKGEEFIVTRSRNRGLDGRPEDIARWLCSGESPASAWLENLMQTTLIRDETIAALSLDLPEQARFAAVRAAIGGLTGPDYSKRTSALVSTASAAKAEQNRRVDEAQAELGRTLTALTEARSLAEREADVNEAEQIIGALAPGVLDAGGRRVERLRGHIADSRQSVAALADVLARAESLQTERLVVDSEVYSAELVAAHADYAAKRQAKEDADESLVGARRLEAAERERDAFAGRMVALLEHGETIGLQDGHCPLCDALRSSDEFSTAIAAARSKLRARGEGAIRAAALIENSRRVVDQAQTALDAAQQHVEQLEARREVLTRATEQLEAVLAQLGVSAPPDSIEGIRRQMLDRQDQSARLDHALFVLEASSAHDRVAALEDRVDRLRAQLEDETAKLTAAERAVEVARQIDHAAKEVPNQVLTEQFDTVMPLLKELYQRLRPHADWREIETDFGGRVRASLNFTVGDGRNPQFLFSSGQRRAAGIAFLLAIHLSRPWCRLRALLLDDPVQHIDDYRALNLVEVLSAVRRTERQVIIAVEDPALADLLCRRLRSTILQPGRRFELTTAKNGSAAIGQQVDIVPLPREVLRTANA